METGVIPSPAVVAEEKKRKQREYQRAYLRRQKQREYMRAYHAKKALEKNAVTFSVGNIKITVGKSEAKKITAQLVKLLVE